MRKVAAGLVLLSVLGLSTGCSTMNQREVTATVEDKERVCSGSNDCKYLIFTDEGTFENTDTLLQGKFDSSDVYGRIKVGETYTFEVAGFRQGFLSMYPNILSVSEAN